MKLKLDFEDLEDRWKGRQIDLFPWLQGLLALIRSREANLKETRKRLTASTPATIVQFLSSFDLETAKIAGQIIKKQDPAIILPFLLYSLEKIEKSDYPSRVTKSLLDFNPTLSFGYLLGYLNARLLPKSESNLLTKPQKYSHGNRNQIKKSLFQVMNEIFYNLNTFFPSSQERTHFLDCLFEAINIDLVERIPLLGKLETREDFEAIWPTLEVILSLFHNTKDEENSKNIEERIRKLGQETVISLHGFPLESEKGGVLFARLKKIMHYMAILRLDEDKSFLQSMPEKINSFDFSEEQKKEILQKSKAVVKIIDQPDKAIQEILDELEIPFFIY